MENWISVCEYSRKEKDSIEWLFKLLEEEKIPYKEEFKENWFGYIVYEDVEELRNVSNDEEELIKERKKWKMVEKMLCWIPMGMLLIVIVLLIIHETIGFIQ